MIEVEVKLPLRKSGKESDYNRILSYLKSEGFSEGKRVIETDTYFDSRLRPIAKRGEALRIRKIQNEENQKSEIVVTFKGHKMDNISMSRQEVETGVQNAEEFQTLLEAMGFYHVEPIVRKHRKYMIRRNMHACLDRVEGLGDFLELEIVIPETEDKDTALKKIEEVLNGAGYNITDTVTVSYLGMLQGRTNEI